MSLTSLLYTSKSTIAPRDTESVVRQIVARAVLSNTRRGLTGAMLFTGTHFAQVLEGEDASVELLMDALRRDPRHDQIRIARRAALARRRFGDFAMAYMGPSQFVSRQVTRLLDNPSPCDQRRLTDWLIELMSEFACDPADQPFFYISPTGTTHLRTSD